MIGAGGMGEVYRARDLRLNRDVAIKVLPDAFTRDSDRLARFEREAQVLASLNHPNIAAIYGIEEGTAESGDRVRALVMELVDGDTLRCPQPRHLALAYAKQIADALEYAHERGVIHRDLKPANIKVTGDGAVKLLDFGLAKAVDEQSLLRPDATHSPTLSLGATTAGVIVGTAAYMAPEQASGKPADRRADIWSFGAVLFEMLTGQQAFVGESISDTLASVLKVEPDWQRLPPDTPDALHRLLTRCLTKDRKQRLQSIGDARIEVDELIAGRHGRTAPEPSKRAWNSIVIGAAAALTLSLVASVWYLRATQRGPERPAHFSIVPPPGVSVAGGGIVSPDGTRIVFGGFNPGTGASLYVRDLDDPAFKPIAGTEGGYFPFFSPDSQWIAYFDGARLKKVPLSGGSPSVILGSGASCGSWADNDIIYFCPAFGAGISAVSANGGEPRVVTSVDRDKGELWHGFPEALPGGKALVFVVYTVEKSFDEGKIAVVSLPAGEKRILLDGARNVQYLASGHLVFGRDHDVFAVPFDAASLSITGQPVRLLGAAFANFGRPTPVAFSVSAAGPMVYSAASGNDDSVRSVLDRAGATRLQMPLKGFAFSPALSPDGTRVALQAPPDDIWVLHLDSKAMTRLTFEPGEHETPVWSPDGRQVAYTSSRRGIARGVFMRAADGNSPEERLFVSDSHIHLSSWSADGKSILFEQGEVATGWDVWMYRLGEPQPQPLLNSAADEQRGDFSPNGRFLAYESNESGRRELYVQPFPASGAKWQISTTGGGSPRWSPDGRELRYFDLTGQPVTVPVDTVGAFTKGIARPWFHTDDFLARGFCLPALDGVACTKTEQALARVDVMLNWFGKLP